MAKPKSQSTSKSKRASNDPVKAKPRARSAARLAAAVRPTIIDLHFHLDPAEKTFHGRAEYALQLDRRTRKLEFHAVDLRISKVRVLSDHAKVDRWVPRIELRPESETVVFHFDGLLPIGALRVQLDFRGRVRSDLRGLYRSLDDREPWIATQLCPTDARRFFPCFDEPGIKARYRIRVTTAKHQTVLSNSPIESEEEHDGDQKTVCFECTPLLSAYLVAVAVGPFVAAPPRISGSTPIRVYTLPDRQHLAEFALETAGESLSRLEDWFGMSHPYAKLDLLALPDFAFGAMENAGAVFFRDSVLLLDPEESSFEDRKRAAETITHEISHMWFGNLVTMAWWNDLWLNESFATWMACEIIQQWRPDWQIWLDFAHRREEALSIDALASSHPIAPKIRSAQEAHENFDAITYSKGACVLRMLEGFLGPTVFRDGIRLYMTRHREGAASASDLWSAIAEISGLPIEDIVAPWTLQTGYPVVSLQRKDDSRNAVIELTQQRFLALPAKPRPGNSRTGSQNIRWQIPWVGRAGASSGTDSRTISHLLVKRREKVDRPDPASSWIYGNAGEAGFFRVEYGKPELDALVSHLPALTAIERIGFIGNQWALARAGRIRIEALLDLLASLGREEDPDVLLATSSVLGRLERRLAAGRGASVERNFRGWMVRHFGEQIDLIGFHPGADEPLRQRMRRSQVFRIVGQLAHADAILEFCTAQCAQHFASGEALPSELGDPIVRIAARRGDADLHETLCQATRGAATPQARRRMLFALAEFEQPELIGASLAAGFDASLAPVPDRAGLLAALLGRPSAAAPTWEALKDAWPRLEREMPPILLARVAAATSEALPPSSGRDIQQFFKRYPLRAGGRVLRQVAEEMRIVRQFETESGSRFESYLEDRASR